MPLNAAKCCKNAGKFFPDKGGLNNCPLKVGNIAVFYYWNLLQGVLYTYYSV